MKTQIAMHFFVYSLGPYFLNNMQKIQAENQFKKNVVFGICTETDFEFYYDFPSLAEACESCGEYIKQQQQQQQQQQHTYIAAAAATQQQQQQQQQLQLQSIVA